MFNIYVRAQVEVCYNVEEVPFTEEEMEVIADGCAWEQEGLEERWIDFERKMVCKKFEDAVSVRCLYLEDEIESVYEDGECIYQV